MRGEEDRLSGASVGGKVEFEQGNIHPIVEVHPMHGEETADDLARVVRVHLV